MRTLPISTTNITGFLTIWRGSSFGNDWSAACLMSCAFQALTPRRRVCAISFINVSLVPPPPTPPAVRGGGASLSAPPLP